MADAFGPDRRVAVCRELTKKFQDVCRGTFEDVLAAESFPAKGEFTVVVEGAFGRPKDVSDDDILHAIDAVQSEAPDLSRKDLSSRVASDLGVPRKRVYQLLHKR
jgi:16S rRNA (cytidine1402-2'-O)-methyltransferase